LVAAREGYDQLAGWFGVEARDPFMDIRVVAFCLALPGDQLQSGGWPKIILRRAAEKIMPVDVAWRRGKEHLGWTFTTQLLSGWPDWEAGMCDPVSPLRDYLSPGALRNMYRQRGRPPTAARLAFFALDRFLRRYRDRRRGN
jgi:asparagine synthase (glutamine-hydrolysing)